MTEKTQKNADAAQEGIDPRESLKVAYAIYGILIAAMVAQFNLYTLLPGTAALIAAIVYAHLQRKELHGTVFENHYRWMTRSFWIGGAVYLPAATIVLFIYQMLKMDMTPVFNAMYEGEKDPAKLADILMETNGAMILRSAIALGVAFALWWWSRCLTGLYYLRRGSPLPNVTRWL